MKKTLKILVSSLLIVGLGATYNSTSLTAQCTYCKVSSTQSENDGHCRAGTYGDVCYNNGSGPACSENGVEECDA